ncbi:TPA: hypothetical protein JG851_004291 [Vibrio parahaemolyticus]|uniref:DUF7716 domain-containing protein n=1 Tax=Vibrio parahaemolyticus TaxID=670 RepID=UPI00235E423D|nr:hypothetical protein [Vibrio parahaemolyticus]MDG2642624.1 hypothetical protein [Vibrio parahaemolyticus]HBB9961192.1 hypothetical protein [Vibrio parahaemolyticus]HBB9976373.1 hypothetical protein [Vibrio parahaemolyticus]HBC0012877.1 hypothetical protein [Vibrio parahaemolyticus]
MILNTVVPLDTILLNVNKLPWEYALYIPSQMNEWSENTQCMVLDPDETDDPDDDPEAAKLNGFKYAFSVSILQDIIHNLKNQNPRIDNKMSIKAIKHYYEHDSFLIVK